jgi:hypothetical protein
MQFFIWPGRMAGRRGARRADFAITHEQATRRVAQGISLADFLQAFRIGQPGAPGREGHQPRTRTAPSESQ